ncbi:MAG: hypothetical protein J6F31_06925 [Oscillospiraceae bacterium]|nr:hypothetical protein [Oscillospiraceae bacterium]
MNEQHRIRKETVTLQELPYDPARMVREALPVVLAMTLFLTSAGYIAYRMMSSYNYNQRWKDYDDCGVG